MRLAIVCAEFNRDVTDRMFERALAYAEAEGLTVTVALRVPGVFEVPFALQRVLARPDVDAAVALGAVVTGETKHDEVLMQAVLPRLLALEAEFGKAIGLGIAGPGMTHDQALDRTDYAERAIDAVRTLAARLADAQTASGGP